MEPRFKLLLQMLVWAAAGCLVGFIIVSWFERPVEGRLALAPVVSQATAPPRVFAADAGIMVKYIKPDKKADFEATIAKLKEALARTDNPERRRQAATWKVFRAVESATNGDVVYVFLIDPAVKGADYAVAAILAEAFPDDAQSLTGRYIDSYSSGQSIVDLALVASLGTGEPR